MRVIYIIVVPKPRQQAAWDNLPTGHGSPFVFPVLLATFMVNKSVPTCSEVAEKIVLFYGIQHTVQYTAALNWKSS